MNKIRIGIIGIGAMGNWHARHLNERKVPNAKLAAICDINPERLAWAKENLNASVQLFDNTDALFDAGVIDAVIIATPHYDHPVLAIEAFKRGLHVLVEKPAGVYTKKVREMNEAAKESGKVFGIMYNQRTNPIYQKLKELIDSGELGELRRTNWIITNWYRTQAYYNSGGWRATWAGEGGGTLLNQNPHQLDLWQWICGLPVKVRAFCNFGKRRDIEVEDDVTAYVEYENGATGVYITSVSDAPGTNRFEITGDKGKILVENNKIIFSRLRVGETQFNKEYTGGFGEPECWTFEVPVRGGDDSITEHVKIMRNWVDAILNGTTLLAPGEEGIRGLQISNAMYLSTWTDNWVNIPFDEKLFYEKLQERVRISNFKKKEVKNITLDNSGTY